MICAFFSRLLRDTNGFGAMELALSMPILLLLSLGMMDASLLIGTKIDYELAAARATDLALAERPNGTDASRFRTEAATAAEIAESDVTATVYAECSGEVQANFGAACADGTRPQRFVEIAIENAVETQFDWSGLAGVIGFETFGESVLVAGQSRVRFQ